MDAPRLSDTEYQHQLMTHLTVAGLNVALVKRRLLKQVPFDHEAAVQSLQRVETAHRSIAMLHARRHP
jgi:hypothetical protein